MARNIAMSFQLAAALVLLLANLAVANPVANSDDQAATDVVPKPVVAESVEDEAEVSEFYDDFEELWETGKELYGNMTFDNFADLMKMTCENNERYFSSKKAQHAPNVSFIKARLSVMCKELYSWKDYLHTVKKHHPENFKESRDLAKTILTYDYLKYYVCLYMWATDAKIDDEELIMLKK
ncbi:hypothetical protein TKK_0010492 [Trichogramma kaykai]|uniref:Uncharacterized protein n=1 Tax=Trichogramma kaykai TaxID=54128 RepID=A0ABD2WWE6_9HYME